jgi:hypothetical protein
MLAGHRKGADRTRPTSLLRRGGTFGAHQRENSPEALRTAEISTAGQAPCYVHRLILQPQMVILASE